MCFVIDSKSLFLIYLLACICLNAPQGKYVIGYYCIFYLLQLVIPFRDDWLLHGEHDFSSFGLPISPAESHIDGKVFFAITAMHILNSS